MFLLSKIIAKEWFKALIGSIVVLFLLITVGDILNGFLRNYSLNRVLIEYVLKLPDFMGKMLPMTSLLASLFAFNKLKSKSELMAILAAGYSAKKIYGLILGCSLLLGAFQFVNLGYLVPFANKVKRNQFEKSRKNESKYLARSQIGKSGLIWYKSGNYFTSFKAFDVKNNALKDVLVYFLNEDKKLDSIYRAQTAKYIAKKRWKLEGISIVQSLSQKNFPEFVDTRQVFIELNETPEDFNQFKSDITTLGFFDLGQFISRLKETEINSAEYEVMYYEKVSLALICILFALFPVASIFNPNRRAAGFGKSVVFTLIFSIFFWLIHSTSISMGSSGKIPALVATLAIPTLFLVYIAYIYNKNRRL
ncbi:MAG: hypothetical protein CME62_16980 [Halobacteriovoraceae bacterium]|nr:hypothetical protein [Halobacteriovoraceae bacterium]|tara:strand:+ start:7634 stop:8725 length:1092 start_codon:yes stop_codon:yes gene_type:complete